MEKDWNKTYSTFFGNFIWNFSRRVCNFCSSTYFPKVHCTRSILWKSPNIWELRAHIFTASSLWWWRGSNQVKGKDNESFANRSISSDPFCLTLFGQNCKGCLAHFMFMSIFMFISIFASVQFIQIQATTTRDAQHTLQPDFDKNTPNVTRWMSIFQVQMWPN